MSVSDSVPRDEAFCGKVIDRLAELLDRAVAEALAADPPDKTSASLAVTLAQQIGAWVDRRRKIAESAPDRPGGPASPGSLDLDRLESEFTQALEDIRHVRSQRNQLDRPEA